MKKKSSPKEVFGKGLRALRESKKMPQERLAELADIDRTYVYRLENGKRSPSLEVIIKISSAFKLSPGELLDTALNDH